MRVVVDENIPLRTVSWLVEIGHTVVDARGPSLRSASDDVLWAAAQAERALLITTDKGFAAKWAEPHYGVLVVRLRQPNRERIHHRVVLAMQQYAEADWKGLLCVMRDQVQSTRRAPDPDRMTQ